MGIKGSKLENEYLTLGLSTTKSVSNKISEEIQGKSAPRDLHAIVSMALFMRVQDLHKGIVGGVEVESPISSLILVRTMSEAYVYLKGCSEDDEFKLKFINRHVDKKINRIKSIQRDINSVGFSLSSDSITKIAQETLSIKISQTSSLPDAYATFAKFGCLDLYHQVFSHCSLYAHNDAITLESYIDQTDDSFTLDYEKETFKNSALCLIMGTKLLIDSYSSFLKCMGWTSSSFQKMENMYKNFHDRHPDINKVI